MACEEMKVLGQRGKAASRILAGATSDQKNSALAAIADAVTDNRGALLEANRKDLESGKKSNMSEALLDRLSLDEIRVDAISSAVRDVVALPDPVGCALGGSTRPNGLRITKLSVPLGVVGIIYEARPNVTVDAASLCLKSSNACILRGGKEAFCTNMVMAELMREAVVRNGLPADCIQLVEDTTRASASAMMKLTGYLDVLIPRGGAGLIRSVIAEATVPVIETGVGNNHIYVDSTADLTMAEDILVNAKLSRPSVCNAAETLLVHRDAAARFLPMVRAALGAPQLRGCPETRRILGGDVPPASEDDYALEFLDYILAVKVVDSLEEAMDHIARYGTKHSECIVTESYSNSKRFVGGVDAAAVYVNASTRFTDGSEFGFGAEIGISTQKLHARGPMGLPELTTYKYILYGDGQIR